MNQHIGSNFDDFLEEEGILAETEAIARKRVLAFQIAQTPPTRQSGHDIINVTTPPTIPMITGTKHHAIVGKDGKLEIPTSGFPEGTAVEVIVLANEHSGTVSEREDDPDDTPISEIREGIYRGWQDALAGRTKPVSQLWEGLDVD